MMRDYVTTALKKVAPDIPFSITIPEHAEHGDYATNVAFLLARLRQGFGGQATQEKKSPKEIAEDLIKKIDTKAFEKIEIAGNGFINFFLKKELLYKELEEILKEKKSYGKGASKKEKINIEFISANPTGPITLGNGRGAFLGDALAKILKHAGHKVETEYYINDAKASKQIQDLGKSALGQNASYPFIEELYLQNNPKLSRDIKRMDPADAGHHLAQEIQNQNENIIKKLNIHFDTFFHEQILFEDKSPAAILEKEKKHIYKKDGALWFKTSEFGDTEDRVLIRNTGEPTYFLTDLAYHINKFSKRKFTKIIDIWGADHHGYAPRLKAALRALWIEEGKFEIIITQLVRLTKDGKEVKMSKRAGQFETLEDFVEDVGLDAARYFFLEKSPDTHMDFDLGLAKERSVKNPVYYIQYAHARIASILRNADKNQESGIKNYGLLKKNEELALVKKMGQFPEIIEDTANDYHVHRIPRYAYELAQTFHNFYEKHRVITDDNNATDARLSLIKATQIVLQNTLEILGISAPERM